jgi:hypothetical protein
MIKLIIRGKERLFKNKKGIELLRNNNLSKQFKIAKCLATGKRVIMLREKGYKESNGHYGWICLHD